MKCTGLGCLALLLLGSLRASAADGMPAQLGGYRIDNRVYVGEQKEPVSESTTLFLQGIVYDYLQSPPEVFVFDRPHGLFMLLDTSRRLSTRISTVEVTHFTESLKQRAAAQSDPFVQFLADPRFAEDYQAITGTLTLRSPWLTYTLKAANKPVEPEVQGAFREFSDWFVQLSPMLNPNARPPFARLRLNEQMTARQLLPQEVTLVMTPKPGLFGRRVTIRSEHQWVGRLSEADMNRVIQTQQFMAIFNPVSLEGYRKPGI